MVKSKLKNVYRKLKLQEIKNRKKSKKRHRLLNNDHKNTI